MQILKDEYIKTHKSVDSNRLNAGIDLGISSFVTLSNGLSIKAPKPLDKLTRVLTKRQRQLNKKQHASARSCECEKQARSKETKSEVMQGVKRSNNYIKASKKLSKLHNKISNIRLDFIHKLTSFLVRNYENCEDNGNAR